MLKTRQRSKSAQIPAAVGGINAVAAIASMSPSDCIYSFNLQAEDFGMVVREGFVEWANGWDGGEARTVITFEGNTPADNKMWVANEEGIWDVTTQGETTPTQSVTWPSSGGNAGVCSYVSFTNDGNARFLLLCDGENGYYKWTQSTNTWVKITTGAGANQVLGADPDDFAYVMAWKNRIWFVEKDSANAWYLPTAVFEGTVVKFNFGSQFREGGALTSMHNWTLDGGEGVDDYLVMLSSAGDVLIYKGTDPASASTFGVVGSWTLGQVPVGNRNALEFSGELYILSLYGCVALSQLLNGANINDPNTFITRKVAPYVRAVMRNALNSFGWQLHVDPKKATLYINAPQVLSEAPLAFSQYLGSGAWSMVRDLPKNHSASWQGNTYWVDSAQNKLYIQQGSADEVYLDSGDGDPQAIDWSLLTAYLPLQEDMVTFKRCQYIRPIFIGSGTPAFNVQARYDYDITELYGAPTGGDSSAGEWSTAVWGIAVFGGGVDVSQAPRGATGMGRHIAVSINGRSSNPTTLLAFDIIYDTGGLM